MQVAARQEGLQLRIRECPTPSGFDESWELRIASKFPFDECPHSSTKPPLSNRHNNLLELRVSYTKQTAVADSNRYKMALSHGRFRALKCVIPSDTIASTKYIFVGHKQFAKATSEEVTTQ